MIDFSEFQRRLNSVNARISSACEASGRDLDSVHLLPVTKNHPVDAVCYAQQAGLKAVGENRVQEALHKRSELSAGDVRWELIGHLQSNKVKDAVAGFDRIQSVDSAKLLQRINRVAGEAGCVFPILLQCNAGEDPNKYGFLPEAMDAALEVALDCAHVRVDGLMTIAPLDENTAVAQACFERLRGLRDRLAEKFAVTLPELSMGMTGDLEQAIAAGSTQIRVGTALYGSRL